MGKRYTRDQLLSIRSKSSSSDDERIHINIPEIATVTPASGTNTPVARLPVTPEESDKKEEGAVNGGAEGDAKVTEGGEGEPKKKKKKSGGKKRQQAQRDLRNSMPTHLLLQMNMKKNVIFTTKAEHSLRMQSFLKRKFDSTRANILTKYFALGGIESGAKTFNGGLDQETLDNSTAAEIAAIQATDFVRASNAKYYDPSDTENWVVDWEGVAKGFLSYRAPRILGDGAEEVTMFCGVVKNFLNYVLAHEVCKEYTKEVMAARRLCDVAEREFDAIRCLRQMFPGDFTVAASTLFGENYKRHFEINSAWANPEDDLSQWNTNIPVLSLPVCQFVFGGIVAFIGDKSHFDKAKNGDIHVVTIETRFIEVADVHRASANVVKEFSHVKDPRGLGALKPIGKLYANLGKVPALPMKTRRTMESMNLTIPSKSSGLRTKFYNNATRS
ncbi:argonaute siRNA chaperone complex subunit Arb1 [Botrytis cinerea]